MSFQAMTNALSSVLVPIGVAGSIFALACSVVAAFAIARGAAGLAGGAIGLWIVGAVLSMSASFASLWVPTLVAVAALAAAIAGGTVARGVLRSLSSRSHAGPLTS